MSRDSRLEVLFVAGFGPVVSDRHANAKLYVDTLGLPLEPMPDNPDYLHSKAVDGTRYFGAWPLAQAAQSCFGIDTWPADRPVPQAWLEFDVADIDSATDALRDAGYDLLVAARTEPWGQTVTRFQAPEGMLLAVTYTPDQRDG